MLQLLNDTDFDLISGGGNHGNHGNHGNNGGGTTTTNTGVSGGTVYQTQIGPVGSITGGTIY